MLSEDEMIRNMSLVGIVGNILLTAFKFGAGIVGSSAAMISDAVHSLSDVLATFIAMIGAKLARMEPDKNHEYGHERLECVASLILGLILVATGVSIGYSALTSVTSGTYLSAGSPTVIALVAAVVSIAVKEGMFWYTIHYADLANSDAFRADAWHHRADALSSVGALIGIGLSMLGFPIADPIASAVICLFILKVAYEILKDSIDKITDKACDPAYEDDIRGVVMTHEGVERIDDLKTRRFGNRAYVDLEISVDGRMTVSDGHIIAERIHDDIEETFPDVKHVMIHVNPYEP